MYLCASALGTGMAEAGKGSFIRIHCLLCSLLDDVESTKTNPEHHGMHIYAFRNCPGSEERAGAHCTQKLRRTRGTDMAVGRKWRDELCKRQSKKVAMAPKVAEYSAIYG